MRPIRAAAVGSLLTLFLGVAQAPAANQFVLGPAESIALDQPRVSWGLFDGAPSESTFVGPGLPYSALLDTGATGVVLGNLAYFEANYQVQTDGGGNPIQFVEIGVNGTQALDLLTPYTLVVGDPFSGEGQLQLDGVAALGAPTTNLGSYSAIVGMPAMIDRRTLVDLRPLTQGDFIGVELDYAGAAFNNPAGPVFDVPLTLVDYAPDHGPAPTFAPLPFIRGVTGERDGDETQAEFDFVLDTGAQLSIVSSQFAAQFGITVNADGEVEQQDAIVGRVDVQGIGGGVRSMDLVRIDELRIPVTGGASLVFQNVDVGVLDIDPSIDGVFGMNFLTSGYSGAIFGDFTLDDLLGDPEFLQELAGLGIVTPDEVQAVNTLYDLYELLGYDSPLEGLEAIAPELLAQLTDLLGPVLDAPTQPYFNRMILDFTGGTATGEGIMRLELNPAAVPEPSLGALAVGAVFLAARRRVR